MNMNVSTGINMLIWDVKFNRIIMYEIKIDRNVSFEKQVSIYI